MIWKKLALELSLKPFHDTSPGAEERVISKLFAQWKPLIDGADDVSLMLWAADGSEILEYDGNINTSFEWGKWIGVANPRKTDHPLRDAEKAPWLSPRLYRSNPRKFTYAQLHGLVMKMKSVFFSLYGKKLEVGATFDPGPEFSVSKFKYQTHKECCKGHGGTFICCYLPLHADSCRYAAFPNGIPEDTPFGTFFGAQTQAFLKDMEMDYIWFSNGFGFGTEAWGATGAIFDGTAFAPEKIASVQNAILRFWRDFRAQCPHYRIETRGTNFSTGIDVSTDGMPLRSIYDEIPGISGPPNSPSGSLDGNYAMCVVNYLSHIAELPQSQSYTFRFYLNDPWFKTSAWLHLYACSPHDILLPLSMVRLDENGKPMHAGTLHILTVDDSTGEFPDNPARQVISHILEIQEKRPDHPGPVVWIYPFDEYHELAAKGERLEEIYSGDYLIRGAINDGFPVNTVISGGKYVSACKNGVSFTDSVLLLPTVFDENPSVISAVKAHIGKGGKAIFYGPARGKNIEAMLGLVPAAPIDGEIDIPGHGRVKHASVLSGGGLDRASNDPEHNRILAEYKSADARRPACLFRELKEWNGGKMIWIRGTNSFIMPPGGYAPVPLPQESYFYTESFFRLALAQFGWIIEFEFKTEDRLAPILAWRRCGNALCLAGHGRDTTSVIKLRTPDGAPIPCPMAVCLQDGRSVFNAARAIDLECRLFVESGGGNRLIRCMPISPGMPEITAGYIVRGLEHATLVFRPVPGSLDKVRFHNADGAGYPLERPDDFKVERGCDSYGDFCRIHDVSGEFWIIW